MWPTSHGHGELLYVAHRVDGACGPLVIDRVKCVVLSSHGQGGGCAPLVMDRVECVLL